MAIKRYDFETWQHADDAAGEIYTALGNLGFVTTFENIDGHGHQIYRIFPHGTKHREPGTEIMRYEYKAQEDGSGTVRLDYGTSRSKVFFADITKEAFEKHRGVEKIERPGPGG